MSKQRLFLRVTGAICALCVVACGDDDAPPADGSGGAPGTGGAGGSAECAVNVNSSAAKVSYKNDVLPIFGLSCAGSQCHSSTKPKADLFLGPKCDFAAGACTYPTEPNPNPDGSQPLTPANIIESWAGLREASATAPAAKRVVPGDPGASFLVHKIIGIQNDKGLTCTVTDSTGAAAGPCGGAMPAGYESLCDVGASGQSKVDTIVNWIAQGAENN